MLKERRELGVGVLRVRVWMGPTVVAAACLTGTRSREETWLWAMRGECLGFGVRWSHRGHCSCSGVCFRRRAGCFAAGAGTGCDANGAAVAAGPFAGSLGDEGRALYHPVSSRAQGVFVY